MPLSCTRRRSRSAFLRFSERNVARNASKLAIVAVVPVELAILAPEIVARTERGAIRIGDEQHVRGGHALCARVLDQRRGQTRRARRCVFASRRGPVAGVNGGMLTSFG